MSFDVLQDYLSLQTSKLSVKLALPPSFLPSLVEGLVALSRSGLRYPIPNHGLDKSPLASMAHSYGGTDT